MSKPWSRRRTALSSSRPACSNDLGAQEAGAPRVGAFRGRGVAAVADMSTSSISRFRQSSAVTAVLHRGPKILSVNAK